TNITGFGNLETIGGYLGIGSTNALTSLSGLDNLQMIGGHLSICENDALTDLEGLENVSYIGEYLEITKNTSLSMCAIESICNYIASPNGVILIHDNAPGCNSPEEVDSLCNITGVPKYDPKHDLSISPNPVNKQAVISLNIQTKNSVEICIYNTTGICLKSWQFQDQQAGQKEFMIDLKNLPAGVYFCRIQIGNKMVTQKIIKL
ncbi:MAG: T9SS type A sorting domain-containing protein, partial [Bacteroidetes bacterium]|nr:T9SS type A sorting domain-containing protein [Bacteroidota bacterium]